MFIRLNPNSQYSLLISILTDLIPSVLACLAVVKLPEYGSRIIESGFNRLVSNSGISLGNGAVCPKIFSPFMQKLLN